MHIYRRLLGELVYNLMMIIGERIESDYKDLQTITEKENPMQLHEVRTLMAHVCQTPIFNQLDWKNCVSPHQSSHSLS